jgi:hypothetical protein
MNIVDFFTTRLNGRAPFKKVFINDMLVIGTMINVIATSIALVVMIQTDNAILAVILHALPLPYNAFLVLAVWRSSGHDSLALMLAAVWFVLMTII